MRIGLPCEMLMSNAWDPRMVLQNPNTIAARAGINNTHSHRSHTPTVISTTAPTSSSATTSHTMGHQRPVIDLLVAMIAVPVMILCALQLEKNLHDMANSPESRWLVFALGIGMLVVSVIICGYVTHRMGVCIWAGPIDEAGNRASSRNVPHINSQNDILRIVDTLPPSYESVVKCDIPPPPYHDCLVIDIEHQQSQQCKEDQQPETSSGGGCGNDGNGDGDNKPLATRPAGDATIHI